MARATATDCPVAAFLQMYFRSGRRSIPADGADLEAGERGGHFQRLLDGNGFPDLVSRLGARRGTRIEDVDDLGIVRLVDADQAATGKELAGESSQYAHLALVRHRVGAGRLIPPPGRTACLIRPCPYRTIRGHLLDGRAREFCGICDEGRPARPRREIM